MGYCKIGAGTSEFPCPHVTLGCRDCSNWHSDEIKTESSNLPKVDPLERAKELANAHWEYVEDLLHTHLHPTAEVRKINFHYQSAFEHGYKHAIEDIKTKEVIEPEGN